MGGPRVRRTDHFYSVCRNSLPIGQFSNPALRRLRIGCLEADKGETPRMRSFKNRYGFGASDERHVDCLSTHLFPDILEWSQRHWTLSRIRANTRERHRASGHNLAEKLGSKRRPRPQNQLGSIQPRRLPHSEACLRIHQAINLDG